MIAKQVAEWTRCQREQRRLCGVLEQMADRLPLREVPSSQIMIDTLSCIHLFEERDLFPALSKLSRQVSPLLDDFVSHHRHDRSEAAAIAEALDGADIQDVKALRARIRSFAEGIRRHVQFEEAICRALFARRETSVPALQ